MTGIVVVAPYSGRWYFDAVLAGLGERIARTGRSVGLVEHPPGSPRRAAEVVEEAVCRPDVTGVVLVGIHLTAVESAALLALGKPIVAIGGTVPELPAVLIDDVAAARAATNHLIELGHRDIAHLGGRLFGQMDFAVHARRLKGYTDAMTAGGIGDRCRVVEASFDPADARRAALQLLDDPDDRPTAIFAVSDEIAFPVLDVAAELGVDVPGDLGVVGIDDHPDAAARGLTTVRQDPARLGELAARLLLDRIDRPARPGTVARTEPTVLVRRTSTRPLEGAGRARRWWRRSV